MVGFNVHEYTTDAERNSINHYVSTRRPYAMLIMDNLAFAQQVRQASGNTCTVVYRKWMGNDNSVHARLSPQEWFNAYRAEVPANSGLWYYCNNEPGMSQDLINWTIECAKLVLATPDAKAVLLNMSVGTPEPHDWSMAKELLKLIAANPDRLILGLHEYVPTLNAHEFNFPSNDPITWPPRYDGISWLISRYRHVFTYCDQNGIKRPKIIFTEYGFDTIGAVESWQQSLPKTAGYPTVGAHWANSAAWQQYKPPSTSDVHRYAYAQLNWIWKAIYRNDPQVVGVCVFCYAAQGGSNWEQYDQKRIPNVFDLAASFDWSKPTAPPIDPEPPDPQPTTYNTVWKVAGGVRIRQSPTTSAQQIGLIPMNGKVLVHEGKFVPSANGYSWVKVTYNGVTGWSAEVENNTFAPTG